MANQEYVDILKQGVETWNQWRAEHPAIKPDLRGASLGKASLGGANLRNANLRNAHILKADLSKADLSGADLVRVNLGDADLSDADLSDADLIKANLSYAKLSYADLTKANLSSAHLTHTNLRGATLSRAYLGRADLSLANLSSADLTWASLIEADLSGADFSRANLGGADLSSAILSNTDLSGADLTGVCFTRAVLIGTDLSSAILTGCFIYGISVWDVQLEGATQDNLVITQKHEPTITIDNLEVAQFIYLLLNNKKVRDVIDTITSKAVLILGRFTPERKAILDILRKALRTQGYLPIVFDFEKPSSRNFTETVRTLAHLSRFIIADLTDPSSIPQELQAIIPTLAVPIQPVLLEGKREYAMFIDFLKTYHWVLPIHYYRDHADLIASLQAEVIAPAESKAQELGKQR